jgi:hypothetical protein
VKLFYNHLVEHGICKSQPVQEAPLPPVLVTAFCDWFRIHRGVKAETGGSSGFEPSGVGPPAAGWHSSLLMVSAWLSTSFRSRPSSAIRSTLRSLPLGQIQFAGILPVRPRKTGERRVNPKNRRGLKRRR